MDKEEIKGKILPIYAYGSAVLEQRASAMEKDYPDRHQLVADMFETMHNASGVGLAGPQIGLGKRIFVVDTAQLLEGEPKKERKIPVKGIAHEFINPEIIELLGEEWSFEEGCLSIPGVNGKVERRVGVRMKWRDKDGELHEELFEGMEARVILHEYDHLEGKLFTNYLPGLKKRMIRRKLDKIRNGKIKEVYPMVFP